MRPLFENISFLNKKSSDDIEVSYKKLMKEFFTVFKKYCKDGTPKLVDNMMDLRLKNHKPKKNLHIEVSCKGKYDDNVDNNICLAFETAAKEIGFQKANLGGASKNKKYPTLTLECISDQEDNIIYIYCDTYVNK